MAKDFVKTFIGVCNYLQDPRQVARFQTFCGIKGVFTDKPTEADNEFVPSKEAGEQEYPRQRKGEQNDSSDVIGNGAAVLGSAENAGDATPVSGMPGSSSPSRPTAADNARAKPLRRNSLTGDVGQEFIIQNKFLFYLFTFGTELGNEMFFIAFFPFLFWNVDALVSRRLIVVWAWNLFVGQSTKDLVRWSRPASPPVVKVEVFYNSEYSMPSTHAMTGTMIPFCLFLLSYGRWQVRHFLQSYSFR